MRFVPSAKDHWFANDKGCHLGLWFILTALLLRVGCAGWLAVTIAFIVGIWHEICDGKNLFMWSDPDGFSWRDLVADAIGIVGALLIWP